jgi:hypothetical protein
VYYQVDRGDGTNGYWHLRYNSTSTYWDFLGGPRLFVKDTGTQPRNTASPTYQTTGSPSINAPLAGDYEITLGDEVTTNATNTGNDTRLGLFIAGTQAGQEAIDVIAGATGLGATTSNTNRVTGITASQAIAVRYKSASSLSANFYNMYVWVSPVRVK